MTIQPDVDIFQLMYLLLEVALKSAVILGAACLLARFLRGQSAAIRATIYSTGIIMTLAFIIAAPVMPRWTVSLPQWISLAPGAPTAAENQVFDGATDAPATSVSTIVAFATAMIWLAGSGSLSLRFFKNLLGLRQLRMASDLETDARIHRLLDDVTERLQVPKKTITILQSRSVGVPITWGCFRHIVMLPHDFNELSSDSQRLILTHEIVHIARRDFVFRTLAELLCTVLWFQPLSWTVGRRLCEEQERVSDDHILSLGERASEYARLLLECHDRLSTDIHLPIALGIVERNSLRSRIDAILNPSVSRRPVTLAGLVLVFFVATTLLFPLTMLNISTQAESAVELLESGGPSAITLSKGEGSDSEILEAPLSEKEADRVTASPFPITPRAYPPTRSLSLRDTEPTRTELQQAPPDQPGRATATQTPERNVEERKVLATDTQSTGSSLVKSSPPRGASQMVEQVFENIRHGFKNGKRPVTVLEP